MALPATKNKHERAWEAASRLEPGRIRGMKTPVVALDEKLLMDAGGWKAMKEARALLQAGRVASSAYDPPLLRGVVKEGDRDIRAGLRVAGRSDIENVCGCPESMRFGAICAHSLGVGLHWLRRRGELEAERPGPPPAAAGGYRVAGEGVLPEGKLHIVIPPNIEQAIGAGKPAVVAFELERAGKRALCSGAVEGAEIAVSAADHRVLAAARELGGGKWPGLLQLSPGELGRLLAVLRGHPRVTLARKVAVAVGPWQPEAELVREGDGGLRICGKVPGRAFAGGDAVWVVSPGGAEFRELGPGLGARWLPVFQGGLAISSERVGEFVAEELPKLRACVELAGAEPWAEPERLRPGVRLMLDGSLGEVRADPVFQYGAATVRWGAPERAVEDSGRWMLRDEAFERGWGERLAGAGFAQSGGGWLIRGQALVMEFLGTLPGWGVEAVFGERLQAVLARVERVRPRVEIRSSGIDWFTMEVGLETGGGSRLDAASLVRLAEQGGRNFRLPDGRPAIVDAAALRELREVLAECDPRQRAPGVYEVRADRAAFLAETLGALGEGRVALGRGVGEWSARVFREPGPVRVGDLESVLRPYQKTGVEWLALRADNGVGGVLADDMGLGKTLQMLAYLRHAGGRALVVCPSSLVFNWQREAARFVPERKVLSLEGGDREARFGEIAESDIVVTSYALLRRDVERYAGVSFDAVILDEAHQIKNPDTQVARAVRRLKGVVRFVLTGTPLENRPQDLWSLLDFVAPGYLGDRRDFNERYERADAVGPDGEALRARLARRVRPFLLRRTKAEVAPELPDRIDQVAWCGLSVEQSGVYRSLLEAGRSKIDEAVREGGEQRARMAVLAALVRLRQACCDLRLLDRTAGETAGQSGKMALLEELLDEAFEGGHRVLVFSQFVRMLELIGESLDSRGIRYCMLHGGTRDRAAEVDRFQSDPGIPVFLISLKAGGVGLNLTGADTVIHYDPWWNPAAEEQATDRAHRIGQTRVVNSYRLITRGTVEERILELQGRKRELVRALVDGEGSAAEGIDLSELRGIFESGGG
jgi:superfamily II DNA or RNA helicase